MKSGLKSDGKRKGRKGEKREVDRERGSTKPDPSLCLIVPVPLEEGCGD